MGVSKAARNKMYEVFKKLMQTINSLAFLQGKDKFDRLIRNINQELVINPIHLRKFCTCFLFKYRGQVVI